MVSAIKKSPWFVPVLLFLITLSIRLISLEQTSVYPDEITWMVKGKEFVYALIHHQTDYLKNAWWNDNTETYAIGIPVVILSGIFHVLFSGTGRYSLKLFSDIFASRLPIIILNSFTPVVLYLFIKRFMPKSVAFLASLTYALSPIIIGSDKYIMHDSSLTLFSIIALTSFYLASIDKKITVLPGLAASLAFLEKPTGVLVFISWAVVCLIHFNKQNIKNLIINGVSFWVGMLLLWPQSWFTPVVSVFDYTLRQFKFTHIGLTNFYLGQATVSPNWSYYIFQFLFRTPEIIVILFILSIFFLLKSSNKNKNLVAASPFIVYCLLYFIIVSLATAKAGIRYALPILPWIYVAASWAAYRLSISLKISLTKLSIIIVLLCLPALYFVPECYGLYYNVFIGGPANAQKHDMVGLCVGNKAALHYLETHLKSGKVSVLGCADSALYHTGLPLTKDLKQANFVVVEEAEVQQNRSKTQRQFIKNWPKLTDIYQKGVKTATIYQLPLPPQQ